jgi:hypothetical protein
MFYTCSFIFSFSIYAFIWARPAINRHATYVKLFGFLTLTKANKQEFIEPKIDILNNPDKETASSDK